MQEERIPRAPRSAAHGSLGIAVRELRARFRLSQEMLGFRAGLHRNYVGSLERGEVNPTFGTLLRLASGIEIPLSGIVVLCEERAADVRVSALYGSVHR